MIFFGDSLSDVGNNTWVFMDNGFSIGAPITNPNDENQKYLWVNYLAQAKLGNPVYPSSSQLHLDPLNDSISYAYASAVTDNEYLNIDWPQNPEGNPYVNTVQCTQAGGAGTIKNSMGEIISTCVPGVVKQVEIYLKNVAYKPNPATVFFIWAGSNDLAYYLKSYIKLNNCIPSRDELLSIEKTTVNNINEAKNKLIDAGVKSDQIYILTLPDSSKTPAVLTSDSSWKWYITKILFTLSSTLSETVNNFNRQLVFQHEEGKYAIPRSHYIDIADLFDRMITSPNLYGLRNIDGSCVLKNGTPVCSGFLFYNNQHPTTYVYKIIADKVASVLNS